MSNIPSQQFEKALPQQDERRSRQYEDPVPPFKEDERRPLASEHGQPTSDDRLTPSLREGVQRALAPQYDQPILEDEEPRAGFRQYEKPTPSLTQDDQPTRTSEQDPAQDTRGRATFNSERRPLDTASAPGGGASVGGKPDLPSYQPKLGDKILGKAQKMAGKVFEDPELHEKGMLREAGGKAAAGGGL